MFLAAAILPTVINIEYFYTTDKVVAADIGCIEHDFTASSIISCGVKCSEIGCYKFRFENGRCKLTRRRLSHPRLNVQQAFYRKVLFQEPRSTAA